MKQNDIVCPVSTPNITKTHVKDAIASALLPADIRRELCGLGLSLYFLPECDTLPGELAFHPELQLFNLKKGVWAARKSLNKAAFPFINNLFTFSEPSEKYPNDCIYNVFSVNNRLFCGTKTPAFISDLAAENGMPAVRFRQNYVKCSVLILDENSIITSDKAICEYFDSEGFNALYVTTEGIMLNGYSCGFIGGTGAMISKKDLVLFGSIGKYKDGLKIKSFCANIGIDICCLSNDGLYDYGGLLPLSEYLE